MNITTKVVRRARRHYGLTLYTRDQWGSSAGHVYAARRRSRAVRVKKADTVVQHITVTRPSGDFKEDARTVERIGLDRFGSGVSYNFLVHMQDGRIALGQPLDAKGTHTVNNKDRDGFSYDQNHAARAIAVVGMPETPLSEKAVDSMARLLAAMMDVGAITSDPDYKPHSFFAWKDCPCDATRNRMDDIYKRAVAYHTGKRPAKEKKRRKQKDDRPTVSLRKVRLNARHARWARVFPGSRDDVALVTDALKAEGEPNYRQWQQALGYEGSDADGIPGEASLTELGDRHGFRVVK